MPSKEFTAEFAEDAEKGGRGETGTTVGGLSEADTALPVVPFSSATARTDRCRYEREH